MTLEFSEQTVQEKLNLNVVHSSTELVVNN